jgi:hypothetical protein
MPWSCRTFRAVAAVLATAGIGWGSFCVIFLLRGDLLRSLLLFGPGYVVTIGYLWRAIVNPDPAWRRVIWGASALVQGGWIIWSLIGSIQHGRILTFPFANLSNAWWACSFVASLIGVLADVDECRPPRHEGDQ